MQFKIPAEVMALHGDAIRSVDWTTTTIADLSQLIPDGGFIANDRLELAGFVVRPATLGAAVRMRKLAQKLPPVDAPPEDIDAILKRRNPEVVE